MDGWIIFNFLCSIVALVVNMRRFKPTNPRRWMRFAASLIALYIGGIYFLNIIGVIPEFEVRYFMRWFQGAITIYLIVEAWNG